MKTIHTSFFLLILFASIPFGLCAQETQDSILWRVETKDDNTFVGKVIERQPEAVILETENFGVLTIQMDNIRSMQPLESARIVEGEVWTENPQATRYFWAPNGYALKPGEGYYQNVWVLFNQVSVGITNNVSIGGGVLPLFLFAGGPTPVWITPKVSFPVAPGKFHLGGGALLGTVIGEDAGGFFGIPYGVATIGSRDKNLNIGLGYGFADGDWAQSPTITLSGLLRLGPRGYLVTENYYIDAGGDPVLVFSGGGRTVWTSLSLDYGLIIPIIEDTSFFAIPWLGLSVPFGRK